MIKKWWTVCAIILAEFRRIAARLQVFPRFRGKALHEYILL
jgi:hypothetical protein